MQDAAINAFLVCRSGSWRCALPLASLVEVLRAQPVSPIGSAPWFVRGLAAVRGQSVVVVETARLWGGSGDRIGRRWVSCRAAQDRPLVLAWEEIEGIGRFDDLQLAALTPLLARCTQAAVDEIAIAFQGLALLLSVAKVLPEGDRHAAAGPSSPEPSGGSR